MCTSGNVFERLPAREGPLSAFFEKSKNLESSSADWDQEILWNMGKEWDEIRRVPQYQLHFVLKVLEPWTLCIIVAKWCDGLLEIFRSRNCIFEKSQTHWSFKYSLKSLCKINRRSCGIAVDHRAKRFPWLRNAWCEDCVCTENIFSRVHFQRRVSLEEQRAQKYYRFLRGRQIAYMIYDYFRATGAYEAVQGLSDLFNVRLHDDDVQDFDTVKFLQRMSWKVCTSPKYRIPFSFTLYWLRMNKKTFETTNHQTTPDWRHE